MLPEFPKPDCSKMFKKPRAKSFSEKRRKAQERNWAKHRIEGAASISNLIWQSSCTAEEKVNITAAVNILDKIIENWEPTI